MEDKAKNQTGNKKKISLKEDWEGPVTDMLSFILPPLVGVLNLIFSPSRIPVTQWIMILIGALLVVIAIILYKLSYKVAIIDTKKGGSSELITRGIYAHIRHPHYLGGIVWALSFTFFFRSYWVLLVWIISLPMFYYLARSEEKKLIEKFGEDYLDYKKRVGMFLPRIRR